MKGRGNGRGHKERRNVYRVPGAKRKGKRPSGRSRNRGVCKGPVETELIRLLWGLGFIELDQD
jgi:hypothetical protein